MHAPQSRLPDIIKLTSGDVFTGQLTTVCARQQDIAAGRVHVIDAQSAAHPDRAIDILLLCATHSLLARALFAPVKEPAFWMRSIVQDETRRLPVLPVPQLVEISRMHIRNVEEAVKLLQADGCLDVVSSGRSAPGVVLRDGFVNDNRFRRHLRM
mgnify:FL=1